MPLLSLRSVSQSYWRGPREIRALRDASLDVHAGSLVSVYGQRHSGKTALLRIAAGFEQPSDGSVVFAGIDLAAVPRRELARIHRDDIAWIERGGPHSPDLTVEAYAALPLYRTLGPRAAHRRARAALARLGVERCAGERWSELTDTARILCAIAQALVREPRLLIADDPTAGLGILDREHVCGILRDAAEGGGLGVLIAVPDMPSMLQSHDVRLLSRGRLVAPAAADRPGDGATLLDFPAGRRSA